MTPTVAVVSLRPVMGGCEQGLSQKYRDVGNDRSHIGELDLVKMAGTDVVL